MLDPIFEWLGRMFTMLGGWIKSTILAIIWPFTATVAFYKRSGLLIKLFLGVLIIPLVVSYALFFWHAAWIRDVDVNYPDKFKFSERLVGAGEQVAPEGGADTTKTCGRSSIVDVTADLIDFNVNRNAWMLSNPLYKAGFFGIDWRRTWVFDNKASFQFGVHKAIKRTSIELSDLLGRVRGTSAIAPDLEGAKTDVQFTPTVWYFNPFDADTPFGPTTPSPSFFRKAIEKLERYNQKLVKCDVVFDARADNLLQFLDRIAKDIGAQSAEIKNRAEAYNSGWFDTQDDNIFWEAKGELYAYYGILKAARVDFQHIIKSRNLDDIWNLMEDHLYHAIDLDPFIVSNGKEDGWLMPSHLTTIGFYILRIRSNLVEIRQVLDR